MKTNGIILGKGAPNRCKDGSATMCAIMLTPDLGLIRIYPIRVQDGVKVWSRVEINAEASNTDNRRESWKLKGIRVTGKIEDRTEKAAILDRCVLKSGTSDPIKYQDSIRSSIAIVRGDIESAYVQWGQLEQQPDNYECEDAWISCQVEYAHKPYLHWRSHAGKEHRSHIVSHEAYEWIRKRPTQPHALFDNMQLMNPDYIHWLVLGNMKNRRNVWVMVHAHRLKAPVNASIGFYSEAMTGKSEGWPYLRQEAENAKRAEDPQLPLMFTTSDTTRKNIRGSIATAI